MEKANFSLKKKTATSGKKRQTGILSFFKRDETRKRRLSDESSSDTQQSPKLTRPNDRVPMLSENMRAGCSKWGNFKLRHSSGLQKTKQTGLSSSSLEDKENGNRNNNNPSSLFVSSINARCSDVETQKKDDSDSSQVCIIISDAESEKNSKTESNGKKIKDGKICNDSKCIAISDNKMSSKTESNGRETKDEERSDSPDCIVINDSDSISGGELDLVSVKTGKLDSQTSVQEDSGITQTAKGGDDSSSLASEYLDDFFVLEEDWAETASNVSFDTMQRCIVTDVEEEASSITLTVKVNSFDTKKAKIKCRDAWRHTLIKKGDTILVQAQQIDAEWVVDNNGGLLVVQPDKLISGTTVTSALFCQRKAILAETFKKMEDLPYFKSDQTPMVIGCLAHQLFQRAIKEDVVDIAQVKQILHQILRAKDTHNMLYAARITLEECKEQLNPFVPRVFEFIQHYLNDEMQKDISERKENFKGSICRVNDIEENIWLPKLGLKGRVDATVEVNIHKRRTVMPLELKTGRPSFSLEHKGQIIIYVMMMALAGQNTDKGLLLYLRNNNIEEINAGTHEKRDLLCLRNTLAYYLKQDVVKDLMDGVSKLDLNAMELPEPINHPSFCTKCPYNSLCCAYLSKDTESKLPSSHYLRKLGEDILSKYKAIHIDYVLRWICLLQVEENAQSNDDAIRCLWTMDPQRREVMKSCVSDLKVVGTVSEHNSKYKHTFIRANAASHLSISNRIPYNEFADHEYVIVSTNTRINISAGLVVDRKEDSITLLLDRDITKYNMKENFHVDKYSSTTLFSSNLANVGGLLADNEICKKLRNIVIDRKPATFAAGISSSMVEKCAPIFQELNNNQTKAVIRALCANDYMLIKGMPGTGKTQTLVALIEALHKIGQSVIVTAHTNSAVDNVLLKLQTKNIDFLRLGSSAHSALKQNCDKYATSKCNSPESLAKFYSSKSRKFYRRGTERKEASVIGEMEKIIDRRVTLISVNLHNIVGVTCYGANHPLLRLRTFDCCLVDECTQALQSTVLRPLYSAKKFVLVGDPDQLPPVVKSNLAKKMGADESLFVRLDSANNTVNLVQQYRMNKRIMYVANTFTYENKLEAGNQTIENSTFTTPYEEILIRQVSWIQRALSSKMDDAVVIIDTKRTARLRAPLDLRNRLPEGEEANANIFEASIVSRLISMFMKLGAELDDIGVIAPYRAQVNLLKRVITRGIEINTVDQYQGRDKKIIIYSCAKSVSKHDNVNEGSSDSYGVLKQFSAKVPNGKCRKEIEILGDHRRLNVAITRAKQKLIVIGDAVTLSKYSSFAKLLSIVGEKSIIDLVDGHDGFSWTNLLNTL